MQPQSSPMDLAFLPKFPTNTSEEKSKGIGRGGENDSIKMSNAVISNLNLSKYLIQHKIIVKKAKQE